MSKLMQVGVGKRLPFSQSNLLPSEKIVFIVGHAPHIFHRSIDMFGHEDLIILSKRILSPEEVFIVFDS